MKKKTGKQLLALGEAGLLKNLMVRMRNAKYRCTKPNHAAYSNYGERGIKYLLTKDDIPVLLERLIAACNEFPDDVIDIDRIDNNDHYTLRNIRFTTASVSNTNRRPIPKEKNPMFGKSHTSETKVKMSAAKKGKKLSAEHRAKLSEAQKGRKHTAETKSKISEANKGKKRSAETRAKMSASHKGKRLSEATKAKISNAKKGELNYRFKGYYCTPKGKFPSSYAAAEACGVSQLTIFRRVKNPKPRFKEYYFEPKS